MNLIQLHIRPDQLVRFAAGQGLARTSDEDLGYACHAWLRAMFGELAPKPFRLADAAGTGPARLLAYGAQTADVLREHADTFADPVAYEAWSLEGFASRPMPREWRAGRRLGFEVLACPTSRKDDSEKDVFLRRADAEPDARHDRAVVYRDWLAKQLEPGATLAAARLAGFRRVRMLRRSMAAHGGRRLVTVERPQALLAGELVVCDPTAFAVLLARGIGRHRAFGYGMLLLRPA